MRQSGDMALYVQGKKCVRVYTWRVGKINVGPLNEWAEREWAREKNKL